AALVSIFISFSGGDSGKSHDIRSDQDQDIPRDFPVNGRDAFGGRDVRIGRPRSGNDNRLTIVSEGIAFGARPPQGVLNPPLRWDRMPRFGAPESSEI